TGTASDDGVSRTLAIALSVFRPLRVCAAAVRDMATLTATAAHNSVVLLKLRVLDIGSPRSLGVGRLGCFTVSHYDGCPMRPARFFIAISIAAAATIALHARQTRAAGQPGPIFDVSEVSIAGLQSALTAGRVTSRELVLLYLARIAMYEHTLNAVMTVS